MANPSLGVAVIGAGMVGRAHANAYRQASTVFGAGLPDVRLVAIADAYAPFAPETARRFGSARPGRWPTSAATWATWRRSSAGRSWRWPGPRS